MKVLFQNRLLLIAIAVFFSKASISQSVTIAKAEQILQTLLLPYAESKFEWWDATDTLRNYQYSISNFFEQFGTNESKSTINRHHVLTFDNVNVPGNKIILSSSVHKTRRPNGSYTYVDAWTSIYLETPELEVYNSWVALIKTRNITPARSHPFEFSFPQSISTYIYRHYIITCKTNFEIRGPNIAAKKTPSYSIEFYYCMSPSTKPPVN